MTSSPPPEPQSSRPTTLGFKEAVGVFVAFAAIGTILFWAFPKENGFFEIQDEFFSLGNDQPESRETQPEGDQSIAPPVSRPEAMAPGSELFRQDRQPPLPQTSPPSSPGSAEAQPPRFSDVPQDFWAYPFIVSLAQRNIIAGFDNGTFRPQKPVSRAEYAAMIQKAFAESAQAKAVNYKDISEDFWAQNAIQQATRTKFLQGYPGQVFQPGQPIPRVQTLVSLASGLGLQAPDAGKQLLQRTFEDAATVPDWAVKPVVAATQAGLVVNYPNPDQLRPNQATTRAEAAALIYQALVERGDAEPIDSQYIIGSQGN